MSRGQHCGLDRRKAADFRAIEKRQEEVRTKQEKKKAPNDYEIQKKVKSLKNKVSSVESKVSKLEKQIAEIDHELLMDYDATIAKPDFFDTYQQKKKDLENLMHRWEELTEKLESIES